MKRTVRPVVGLALLLSAAWVGACLDDDPLVGPLTTTPLTLAPIVSNPVAAAAATSAAALSVVGGSSGTDVVYVSLPPGTVPDGGLATIRNTRTGASASAAMAAGGFDPVPIVASAGDTLALQVQVAEGGSPVTFSLVVFARRPPVVVRTDPPPRKRDVPLNSTIVVVFSEPISPATAGDIRLLNAGAAVSGGVAVTADGLRVVFTPSGLLQPNTDYVLSISTGVTDLSGDPLEQAVAAGFTTGTMVVVASVATDPVALFTNSVTGQLRTFAMSAILYDDGRVTGSFSTFYAGTGGRAFGPVTCFTVVDGKAAWIASVTEGSSNPALVGREYGWRAVDNGQPEAGVPDQLSLSHFLEPGTLTGQDFCATTPLTDPNEGVIEEIVLNNLLSGNIVVNPVGPPPPLGSMSEIAFAAQHGGIHVIRADGLGGRVLTSNAGDFNPVWSPDGTKLAFERGVVGQSAGDIYVIGASGSGLSRLTSDASVDIAPAWSPDGSRIAFARNGRIHVMNATDGSGVTRLTDGGTDSHPTWSPDGLRIAFGRLRSGTDAIYVMNADGSALSLLTSDSAGDRYPRWSPDGQKIAFERSQYRGSAIYLINADGTGLRQVTLHGRTPAWSPDGGMIVFADYGIALVRTDGSGRTRLGPGFDPDWSPGGSLPPLPEPFLSLQIAGGDAQTDTVRATLAQPLSVRASRDDGSPVQGVYVSWYLWRSGDSSEPSLSTYGTITDAAGIASVQMTLGAIAGSRSIGAIVTDGSARSDGLTFTANATPGTPVALYPYQAPPPFAVVNATVEYSVYARDGHGEGPGGGNLVSGVPITWAITVGGGSITPLPDTIVGTNPPLPLARAAHTVGPSGGTAQVTATASTIAGGPQVAFTTTVVSVVVEVDWGFAPADVVVPSGKTVGWHWPYSPYSDDEHDVTFEDDPTAGSPTLRGETFFFRTFDGGTRTIRYRCSLHSTSFTEGEVGTVTVQ